MVSRGMPSSLRPNSKYVLYRRFLFLWLAKVTSRSVTVREFLSIYKHIAIKSSTYELINYIREKRFGRTYQAHRMLPVYSDSFTLGQIALGAN